MSYIIIPDPGGLYGAETEIKNIEAIRSGHEFIRDIGFLDFKLDAWSGDDITAVGLTLVVTEALAQALRREDITGVRFENVKISKSPAFLRRTKRHPELSELPNFRWMIVEGKAEYNADGVLISATNEDACIGTNVDEVILPYPLPKVMPLPTHALIASLKFVEVLKKYSVKNCQFIKLR